MLIFILALAATLAGDGDLTDGCGCGTVIATGPVTAAGHELQDGSAWVGATFNISAHPSNVLFEHVRDAVRNGGEYEVVLRKKPKLEAIGR